jgi:spermidine synthase
MAKGRETRRERRDAELAARKAERRARAHQPGVVRGLAIAFLVSGAAGLVHEVVWTRLLAHVFGVSTFAISTVLAAFMGGLALGSWWIGARARLADRRRTYAWLEIGIGASALLVPFALDAVEPFYGALWRRFHLSFAWFSVLRFVVAGGILLVPTVLMGATLPVLAAYLAEREGRRLAPERLYTLNLAGAALGVAAAGFVLMPAVGVWGTIVTAAALNVGVGVWVLALPPDERSADAGPAPAPARPSGVLLGVAFLSGALSLTSQVAWTRVLVLVVGSTTYAFSTVLLVYLLALGAGSAWAARRGRRVASVRPDLAVMLCLSALATVIAVDAVNGLPAWYLGLYDLAGVNAVGGIVERGLVVALAVLFPPVFAAGTLLPLALVGSLPPAARGTGAAVGRLYAVNTLGAIVGAVGGGFVLVPALGTQGTLLAVAATAAAAGLALALAPPRPRWLPAVAAPTALLVGLGVALEPPWDQVRLHAGVFEPSHHQGSLAEMVAGERLLFHREGATASAMVTIYHETQRILRIDGRVNASDHALDMATQTLLAQVPLLIAPRTDDVLVVGWGSGVTIGSVLQGPVAWVTAVELEPAVVAASAAFTHVNHEPLRDPRLRLYEDDARHILLADDQTYDVIVSEPSHPWVSGVANLFTTDFYQTAARRLRDDGVFAQWVQTYELDLDTYRTLLATFQSVFPETMVFMTPRGYDSILVGSRRALRLDPDEIARRFAAPATRAELERVGMKRPEYLLASLCLGPGAVRELAEGARLNTDANMWVEFHAVRGTVGRTQYISTELEARATPLEQALPDPAWLTAHPERLDAVVEGLRWVERPSERYEQLRRGPPAG